jgi:hypothetical protein
MQSRVICHRKVSPVTVGSPKRKGPITVNLLLTHAIQLALNMGIGFQLSQTQNMQSIFCLMENVCSTEANRIELSCLMLYARAYLTLTKWEGSGTGRVITLNELAHNLMSAFIFGNMFHFIVI